MEVGNRVERVLPHVEDESVAPLGNSLTLRHPLRQLEHLHHHLAVLGPDGAGVGDVLAGHDEDVSRRSRLDVPERICPISRCHLL